MPEPATPSDPTPSRAAVGPSSVQGGPGPASDAMAEPHERERGTPLCRRLRRLAWRTGCCILVAFAILYAIAAWRFWTARPSITRDFTEEWNRAVEAVPQSDRALPVYARALGMCPDPAAFQPADPSTNFAQEWYNAFPGDPAWPETTRYVARCADAIALMRAASARPAFGMILGGDGQGEPTLPIAGAGDTPVVMWSLGPLAEMRLVARLLATDAIAAANQGDADRAAADIRALIRLAEQWREHPGVIADLSAFAVLDHALRATPEILFHFPTLWEDEHIESIQRQLQSFAGGGPLSVRFDRDDAAMQDILQRYYTDDGQTEGRPTPDLVRLEISTNRAGGEGPTLLDWFLAPLISPVQPSRGRVLEMWEAEMASIRERTARPLWEEPTIIDERSDRFWLVDMLLPAADPAYVASQRITQDRDASLAILALHRHRLRHGRFPESLDDLVADELASVPIDRTDGQPLRYRLVDGEPILYALGQDGDDDAGAQAYTDEGAVPAPWLPSGSRGDAADGDHRYWPPPHGGRDGHTGPFPVQDLSDRDAQPSA